MYSAYLHDLSRRRTGAGRRRAAEQGHANGAWQRHWFNVFPVFVINARKQSNPAHRTTDFGGDINDGLMMVHDGLMIVIDNV